MSILQMKVRALIFVFAVVPFVDAQTQETSATPAASPTPSEEAIIPTFETQKLARTYILDVPAPRGQITDRNGVPLAQNRLSYNLAINFPTPLDFSDTQALSFVREKIDKAEKLIGRTLRISDEAILRHYRNRGIMPLEIAQNLSQTEYKEVKDNLPAGMIVRPVYVRTYPNGKLAGQIVGYTGKTGRNPDGIVDNHETLWPETEGREGLEQTFNEMLTGKHGEYKLTFDKDGRKTSEKLITPPDPGYNVVTTIDLRLQQLAEKALETKAKRGAIVIIDPNNGDILALASWPAYDPNLFVPSISAEQLKLLQDDKDIPLLPRAYRSSYPPGSTFKIDVGIAALESRSIQPDDRYECVPSIQIGHGDVQVTPLQMAQAMGVVANGGTLYQTRLVQQVQTFDNQIVTAYQVRAKRTLNLSSETLDELHTGMIDVVNGAGGTAHQAS